jgi:hypothetical protein
VLVAPTSTFLNRVSSIGEHLVVAKPIVYDEALRTLVTEAMPGTSLSKIIGRGKDSMGALRWAHQALNDFQRSARRKAESIGLTISDPTIPGHLPRSPVLGWVSARRCLFARCFWFCCDCCQCCPS